MIKQRQFSSLLPKSVCAFVATALLAALSFTQARGADAAPAAASEAKAPKRTTGEVKVLDAGSAPRKVLRLHPKAGEKQSLSITIKMAMDMTMGEMPAQAMKLPPMKFSADLTVKRIAANGDISYEMVINEASLGEEPDAIPQVVEAMQSSLSGLKGLTATGVISDRGITKEVEMKVPENAAPQMRQTIEQMKDAFARSGVQLPEQAVGPGAKWEYPETITSQGMAIKQTSTYNFVSLQDDRMVAKTAVTQSAANQKIQNPSMPGLQIDLEKMAGDGKGTVTIDLNKVLPVKGTTQIHTEMAMEMDMGGQKNKMAMKMDMTVELGSK